MFISPAYIRSYQNTGTNRPSLRSTHTNHWHIYTKKVYTRTYQPHAHNYAYMHIYTSIANTNKQATTAHHTYLHVHFTHTHKQAIITQYSLHKCVTLASGDVQHTEYLAAGDSDCRKQLLEHLITDLGDSGSIIVYSSFEKTQLNAMAETFPGTCVYVCMYVCVCVCICALYDTFPC